MQNYGKVGPMSCGKIEQMWHLQMICSKFAIEVNPFFRPVRQPSKIENFNRLPTKKLNFNRQPTSRSPYLDPLLKLFIVGFVLLLFNIFLLLF